MSKIILGVACLVAVAVGLLTWGASHASPGRPNISVAFVGYTNNSFGRPVALYVVTNLSSSAVILQARGIEIQAPAGPAGWDGFKPQRVSVLGAGRSERLTVAPPTNQSPWRLRLLVYPETEPVRHIKLKAADVLRRVGLKSGYRAVWYAFHSDWIEIKK